MEKRFLWRKEDSDKVGPGGAGEGFAISVKKNPQRGSFGLSAAYWEIFQLDHPSGNPVSITNGRKKSLWQKVDFALFLFHIRTRSIKGLPLNRNEIWNYQEIKMLNVELLRGWDWVPLCRSLHGQLVEFFCWNLECFCPPLKRSLFVDGDIFNPRQIDATSFANCKITFFALFFTLSHWPQTSKNIPEEYLIANWSGLQFSGKTVFCRNSISSVLTDHK